MRTNIIQKILLRIFSLGETRGYIRAYCTSFDVADTTGAWRPVRASAFNQQSSKRYKKNIVDIDDEELHKVLRVAVKRFMYKSDQEGKVETGVIAEQLHAIGLTAPVNYDREGRPDAVDYSKFTPYLIGLAQEQEKRIAELETKAKKCEALSALLISKGILTQEEIDGLDV
ncbi:tail fiber domain-containing protein [Christensenella intestinihominis]|uniref:tail fiber domain-containing protein n=1 Tax=Christensenella intestinihominis TaxID=1851429 RepID=UPI0009F58CF0|nr:tail fiber domain-containing protein [Christensenella intestinihominis]